MVLTRVKLRHPNGRSAANCDGRPGFTIWYADLLSGLELFGRLLDVGVEWFTTLSPQNSSGAFDQQRLALVIADNTPMPLSATPRC